MEDKKTTKKTPERAKVEDVEKIVADLGKKGETPSKIGIILKEKYGIQKTSVLGKKITKILREKNHKYDTDLDNINKRLKKLEAHFEKNRQDQRAKREIVRFIGLRKKLEKYKAKKG